MKEIREILRLIREKGLYPEIKIVEEGIPSEPEFTIDGKRVLSFCSANYLGLANNEEIKKAISQGLDDYGIHPSASPMVSGTLAVHRRLEKEIAGFIGKEDAMLFGSSTMANMGVIPAIINLPATNLLSFFKIPFKKAEEAALFSDELNHATVVEGCRLAKGERVIYRHCDMNDLEQKMKKHRKKKRKLILSDGVFSMDGDIAPLKDIVNLAKEYEAMVFVDDASATGYMGEDGSGTLKHFGLKDEVDVVITNFAKGLGVVGGTAVSSKDMIDFLRVTARTYIFSGALLGSITMGVLKALEIVKKDSWRRTKCWENTHYLKKGLQDAGFNTLNSQTPIISILIGDERIAIQMSKEMLEAGIFSPPIRWPAVPQGQARMRFNVTCQYSKEQMDRLIESLTVIGKKHKII